MIQPNSTADAFCTWLLAATWINLTAPQIDLVNDIQTAAQAPSTVTENTWNEFLRITGLYYQYYQAHIAQTSLVQGKWYSFASTIGFTGFSVNPVVWLARYAVVNKVGFVRVHLGGGTSNTPNFTITGLPFKAGVNTPQIIPIQVTNNGSVQQNSGMIFTVQGSNVLTCYTSWSQWPWTNVNTKYCRFGGAYEIQ